MRFAPPKSAPPDTRKCSKDSISVLTHRTKIDEDSLSGWSSVPVPDDLTLLRECAAASLRRCSSATQRHYGQLVVSFSKFPRQKQTKLPLSRSDSNLAKGNSKCMVSKDSGVDDLTDTHSMERMRLYDDDEEFSDISDSDDQSTENEPELMRLTVSDSEVDVPDNTVDNVNMIPNSLSLTDCVPSSLTADDQRNCVEAQTELRNYINRVQNTSSIAGICHATAVKIKSKKKTVKREHQLPNPITPDIPDSPAPTKTQLWSRAKKLERHSTSPSLCTYNEAVSLHANRPPYRNEKRRTSNVFKSSCSIPSFSTPCQALLLVGVQPANKPTSEAVSNRNKFKHAPHKSFKPPHNTHRPRNNIIELPALSVNGAGDLVIRKKQIISG